jgi:predicted membrane metal-binding protein
MTGRQGFHEDLDRGHEVKGSSERSFGLVFAAVFAVVALWPLLKGGEARGWAGLLALLFLAAALLRPRLLAPLNRLWFRFGLLLHKVVNPLVMGLLFFLTVTPIALLMRGLGKDPLRLRFDPAAESYWIPRQPPGPAPDSMRHQF